MDKLQKHDYMQTIEQYLEENQVYELFEDLLKQIIVTRPDKPLDYIIEALQHPKCKQIGPNIQQQDESSLWVHPEVSATTLQSLWLSTFSGSTSVSAIC